jgi:hypothetical protein
MKIIALGYRVARTAGRLVVREPLRIRILLLGAYSHQVVLDSTSQTIVIDRRIAWLHATRQKIPFADVRAVTYGYDNLARPPAAAIFGSAGDSFDHFSVGLKLVDGSELTLFDFVGEGGFQNDSDMPDWAFIHLYLIDYLFGRVGSQERESRALVDQLCDLLSVPTVPAGVR